MSDESFRRIEAHVVAIGELLEQCRRYRSLAVDAERVYRSAMRIAARVRQASRGSSGENGTLAELERGIEDAARELRDRLASFRDGPAYRELLERTRRGDPASLAERVAEIFADVEPASAAGPIYLPITAKRGEATLDPAAAADAVLRMATDGFEPPRGPGVGSDESIRPIRFFEGVTGLDAPLLVIVSGADIQAPTLRAPSLGEILVYTPLLRVPVSAGLRRQSPDDWLEVRAGGYAQYESRCREELEKRGIAALEV